MGLLEELYKNGVDFSKLPPDCPARASQRLRRFWNEARGEFSKNYTSGDYSRDMFIVFGDPMKGVSLSEDGLRASFLENPAV